MTFLLLNISLRFEIIVIWCIFQCILKRKYNSLLCIWKPTEQLANSLITMNVRVLFSLFDHILHQLLQLIWIFSKQPVNWKFDNFAIASTWSISFQIQSDGVRMLRRPLNKTRIYTLKSWLSMFFSYWYVYCVSAFLFDRYHYWPSMMAGVSVSSGIFLRTIFNIIIIYWWKNLDMFSIFEIDSYLHQI